MHILIVTHYFWPEGVRVNDLARAWKEKGYEVTVIAPMPNYPKGSRFPGYRVFWPLYEEYEGIRVYRCPLITRGNRQKMWRLGLSYLTAAISASILGWFYLMRKRIDLIFVYQPSPVTTGIPAIVFRWFKKAPIMFWVQDLWPESLIATGAVQSKLLLCIVEKLVRLIYRQCSLVLVQSEGFRSRIQHIGVDPQKIQYLPNWAEDFYKPISLEQVTPEQKMLPEGFRVMFAGNIGIAQDFSTILDTAEKLKTVPDIHFIILGDGSMRSWVEEEISKRGLQNSVHLLGRYPVETMPIFFSLADVLLVTLKGDPIFALTIPSKIQSYLACGKPIIAVLNGEGARVVDQAQAGISCPAEDTDALVQAILRFYDMPLSEREMFGKNGRKYFEQEFDRTILLQRFQNLMDTITRD